MSFVTEYAPRFKIREPLPEADTFALWLKMDRPVIIIHGAGGRRMAATEHIHSVRLFRHLGKLAEEKDPIWGLMDTRYGVLSRESLRAFNCFLRHEGLAGFRRVGRGDTRSRIGWDDLCLLLSFRWHPASL